jgi:4-hydroxybenzoyl-CoA thioesterase
MERFFAARCGIPYSDLIANERIGFPTVKIEAEFLTPLIYGDDVDIAVEVAAIGNSSLMRVYTIQRVRDQVVCARVEQVHAAISLETKKPISIPMYLREHL